MVDGDSGLDGRSDWLGTSSATTFGNVGTSAAELTTSTLADQAAELAAAWNAGQNNATVTVDPTTLNFVFTWNTNNVSFTVYVYTNIQNVYIPVAPFQAFELATPESSSVLRYKGPGTWNLSEIL